MVALLSAGQEGGCGCGCGILKPGELSGPLSTAYPNNEASCFNCTPSCNSASYTILKPGELSEPFSTAYPNNEAPCFNCTPSCNSASDTILKPGELSGPSLRRIRTTK